MISNKVVIVTGSGRCIGKGIAKCCAKSGAKVVIAEIDKNTGRQTEKEILDDGGKAFFIETVVTDEVNVGKMVYETIKKYK